VRRAFFVALTFGAFANSLGCGGHTLFFPDVATGGSRPSWVATSTSTSSSSSTSASSTSASSSTGIGAGGAPVDAGSDVVELADADASTGDGDAADAGADTDASDGSAPGDPCVRAGADGGFVSGRRDFGGGCCVECLFPNFYCSTELGGQQAWQCGLGGSACATCTATCVAGACAP
jgi:hypothetical protein